MKNIGNTYYIHQLVGDYYRHYHVSVYLYILHNINNKEEAEDLTQDVFLRLLNYKNSICTDTIKCFIYTIARNLIHDYLRRYQRIRGIMVNIANEVVVSTNEMESNIIASDLLAHETYKVASLPSQCRKIYTMVRFEDMTIADTASILRISPRTVENQLFIGRREIRNYIQKCII